MSVPEDPTASVDGDGSAVGAAAAAEEEDEAGLPPKRVADEVLKEVTAAKPVY